jgi:hypothetical protein
VRKSGLLGVPSAVVAILLVFWLIRVRFASHLRTAASKRKGVVALAPS